MSDDKQNTLEDIEWRVRAEQIPTMHYEGDEPSMIFYSSVDEAEEGRKTIEVKSAVETQFLKKHLSDEAYQEVRDALGLNEEDSDE